MNEFKNKNIYDLKNLLFKSVVENDKEAEKLIKNAIKEKMSNIANFMFNV